MEKAIDLTQNFVSSFFDKHPCLLRLEADILQQLGELKSEIDFHLSNNFLFYPETRLVKDGDLLGVTNFTIPNSVDKSVTEIDWSRCLDFFYQGYTIILQSAQNYLPLIERLNIEVWRILGSIKDLEIHSNIYITPANSKGFSRHFDTHDVFVIQIEGAKNWKIWEAVIPKPLIRHRQTPYQNYSNHQIANQECLIDTNLEFGHSLYIPRGFAHEVKNIQKATSIHITLAIKTKNKFEQYVDDFRAYLDQNYKEEDFRNSYSLRPFFDLFEGYSDNFSTFANE